MDAEVTASVHPSRLVRTRSVSTPAPLESVEPPRTVRWPTIELSVWMVSIS